MTVARDKWRLKVRIPRLFEAEGEGMIPTILVAVLAALMIVVVLTQVGGWVMILGNRASVLPQ